VIADDRRTAEKRIHNELMNQMQENLGKPGQIIVY
jgi:hypothetical protein